MAVAALAPLAIGASVLGGITSAVGAVMTGQSNAAMYGYRAKAADNMADYYRQVGEVEGQKQQMKTAAILGGQKASYAANGIDVTSGSVADVAASTAKLGKLDELIIRSNAENKALGLENDAMLDKFAAKNSKTEGFIKAGTSILGTVGSVSDKWLSYKRTGISMFG